ncbi:hypothetical protein QBC34DRAFT_112927 [Podospora aff. communis PSN243]|uniref:C2H2-type domain-containing protein n=1 Tax=Podospora aff. communis PSN243 TaxID=3040156 RepID=A0AAV9GJU8_9PEZI|nr:hypothetical protein QBC34DRAFT_112927 [Podospora aff. communis PSN243]
MDMTGRQPQPIPQQQFACHFAKRDPERYRDCLKFKFKRTSDLTQHFWRKHLDPIQCPKCGAIFEDDAPKKSRDDHIKKRQCEVQEFLPNNKEITWDQKDEIETGGEDLGKGTRAERRWHKIWDILFKGHPRPASPYVTHLSELVSPVVQSWIKKGGIRRIVGRYDPQFHYLLATFAEDLLADLQHAPQTDHGTSQHSDPARLNDRPVSWLQPLTNEFGRDVELTAPDLDDSLFSDFSAPMFAFPLN